MKCRQLSSHGLHRRAAATHRVVYSGAFLPIFQSSHVLCLFYNVMVQQVLHQRTVVKFSLKVKVFS